MFAITIVPEVSTQLSGTTFCTVAVSFPIRGREIGDGFKGKARTKRRTLC
jgi:hypothetical protein